MGIFGFLRSKNEEVEIVPQLIPESDMDSLFVSTLEQLTGTTFTGSEKDLLQESIKAFKNKDDPSARRILQKAMGEGFEDYRQIGYGNVATGSFNLFYKSFIDRTFQNEIEKIKNYRSMSEAPEIADVIEDIVNEATMLDEEGKTIHLEIVNEKLSNNKNISDTLNKEFEDFFYKNLNINDRIWEFFKTYMIDGRLYLERVVNEKSHKTGLLNLKKLPSESMDFYTDPRTSQIIAYIQAKDPKAKRPLTVEEAEKDSNFIVFNPSQISFVDYGIYGQTRRDILGYLEKCKVPFNQLKLLETSVIIYRIVRAPERLVFSIDTGNMPRNKAMKFVEKVKNSMLKKQTYDPQTGRLTHNPDIFSILENIYLPRCLSLNTSISLVNHKDMKLKDIIKEYDKGIKHQVFSVNQSTGKEIIGDIEWAGITRKNADLVRVWFENGEYEDVTPDHKFLVWKTQNEIIEVEAQNLTENMDLVDIKDLWEVNNYDAITDCYRIECSNRKRCQKKCLNCGKLFLNIEKVNFCSKSCSSTYNNTGRKLSEETKEKISKTRIERKIPASGKHSYEYVKSFVEEKGYKLLSNTYISNKEKLDLVCPVGHHISIRFDSFKCGNRCEICSGKKKHDYKYIKDFVEREGYHLISKMYEGTFNKLELKCAKGHSFKMKFNNFQQGQRCPECASRLLISKGEKEVLKFVESLVDVEVIPNDREQIKNPRTNRFLELDIWIPSLNKAIEYNGRYWHSFKHGATNDLLKQELCLTNGIDLLVIEDEDWLHNNQNCKEDLRRFLYES